MLPTSSVLAVNSCLAISGSATATMLPNTGTLSVKTSPWRRDIHSTVLRRASTKAAAWTNSGSRGRGGNLTSRCALVVGAAEVSAMVASLIEHSRLSWYFVVPMLDVVRYRLVPDMRKGRR